MWLSVLTADLPNQLTFVLEANAWSQPQASRMGGWLQTIAVQQWAAEAQALAPSLFPEFGASPPQADELVRVTSERLLRADVTPQAHPVRARSWQERCGVETNSSGFCVHIVVVNLVQDSPASFTLNLTLSEKTLGAHHHALPSPLVASRLFESGGYDVKVSCLTAECDSGTIVDWVGASETVVYEIGCNGPRPESCEYHDAPAAATISLRHSIRSY
jgi:hypothetical protein